MPIEVRRKAETLGAPGRRWLDCLGDVVAELERDWDVVVGAMLSGGSDSYLAEAATADGGRAVLKLGLHVARTARGRRVGVETLDVAEAIVSA